ncbi:sulfatase [Pedobacter lusitanus]|uniref:Sulfatase n=1 Tax=Pedobacter lusitanus TaxID=1503925 RepID=A0A0D0GP81_9SPHI|nr:sulfatase [Pedobacter lusitanus]KIO77980.1 sulfatase [Pedobacter lusitanus]
MKNKIKGLFIFLCLLGPYQGIAQSALQNKPNVIFFLVDDMGWQDTSVPFWEKITPANQKFHTPNMEKLAASSMKFTQAYANSVCTPTRVSFLTGMNAARHRVTNWTSAKNETVDYPDDKLSPPKWNVNGLSPVKGNERSVYATTLPQLLAENGYYTIQCGKAHFGAYGTIGANPLKLGFVKNVGGSAAGHPASYLAEDDFGYNPEKYIVQADIPNMKKYWHTNTFLTEDLTAEAKLAMDTAQMIKKPFFLYMSHYAVHLPYQADKRFIQPYLDRGLTKPEAAYAALIEGMDHSLGELMQYLEQHKLTKNTIIVFMSDNGGFSHAPREGAENTQNYPLRGGKGSLYEGGVREPLIVRWPGVTKPGSTSKQYVRIEDFYPTLLEVAGIKHYKTVQKVDGVSMTSYLKDPEKLDTGRVMIWNYPNNWTGGKSNRNHSWATSLRKGDWKLIYFEKEGKLELYNLKDDIQESRDLAATLPVLTQKLARILTAKLKDCDAQLPLDKTTGKIVPMPDQLTD